MKISENPHVFKCKCGNDKFAAHQQSYHDVIVNASGTFVEDKGIYESNTPYGPFTCTGCGAQHDELESFDCVPEAEQEQPQAVNPDVEASAGSKLRLLLFDECNRDCEGCCNKDIDLAALPVCTSYTGYDMIMLTGGEPMLHPQIIMEAIHQIRRGTRAPIILYTAMTSDKEALADILRQVDGITITLHDPSDVPPFLAFDDFYTSWWRTPRKSYRLNVFRGVKIDLGEVKGRWKVKSGIEWIKNCPLPEGEVLMRYGGARF